MKTFDYEQAWKEIALPAYKSLPTQVHVLVETVAIECNELHQLKDCSMPWPEDGKLRELFERVDSETLSRAAQVVHNYGHWRPGASIAGDAPQIPGGAHWKFAHYADQTLRPRFGLPANGGHSGVVGFQIIEGAIRVHYSSRDCWTWHEVAPATEAGMEKAKDIAAKLRRRIEGSDARDSAACKFMESIKSVEPWPDLSTAGYMIEESEIELRRAARMPKPDKQKLRASIVADYESTMQKEATERDGKLWLVDRDLPLDNCIFYSHTGQFCFGWRKPYTGEAREKILAALKEFPWPYDVK